MDFREATSKLVQGPRLRDVAEACGRGIASVLNARFEPGRPGYRRPPPNWRQVVARMAREERDRLDRLASEVEAEDDVGSAA